ncbi:hypothetical protein CCR94_15510 [Rhodoblastus sphagnicola]|uniref:SnoaL-like domain-containing protein n=1 Tax=Rhodoblastus sphagnicola TaxID=333368 RepID=A0A2S6N416_9HYPH|nr:nuclear transport factor 2 family protein [Rhodoblastus sphagnicola]MBB4199844.1 hypothetical protein [Rhodoblastus sphagnicola]PPQ29363.1 hypothetical protein CCR94_15510 [Rhodoblastus sphagnicola]
MKKYFVGMVGVALIVAGGASGQGATAKAEAPGYKPTVEDWVGVNEAVDNYTLGLELHDAARFDKAFWPEANVIAQPEPGKSFAIPYKLAFAPPPMPPGGAPMPPGAPPPGAMPPPGAPMHNAIGNDIPPWHLPLSHHFEFQSANRATHYGYFVSVYPDMKTKTSTVGLPGHYDDVLEKRDGEWRILQRTTAIGAK